MVWKGAKELGWQRVSPGCWANKFLKQLQCGVITSCKPRLRVRKRTKDPAGGGNGFAWLLRRERERLLGIGVLFGLVWLALIPFARAIYSPVQMDGWRGQEDLFPVLQVAVPVAGSFWQVHSDLVAILGAIACKWLISHSSPAT